MKHLAWSVRSRGELDEEAQQRIEKLKFQVVDLAYQNQEEDVVENVIESRNRVEGRKSL